MDRRLERLAPWLLRGSWLVTGVVGSDALAAALADHGDRGAVAVQVVSGVGWVTATMAMFFLSVPTLTLLRATVPAAVPAAVLTWIAGGSAVASILALAAALVATAVAFLPDTGRAFVQASAYGEEDRHVLRPPAAYLAAVIVSWVVSAAAVLVGAVLLGAERWIPGGLVLVLGIALSAWSSRRWHRLARRWLVVVPAGLVIHDHLVLAETLMLRRVDIAGIGLAPAGTRAADLTGPAGGHALQIDATSSVTAIYAGTPSKPGGTAIHLTACLVAPTRPGRALAAAVGRG